MSEVNDLVTNQTEHNSGTAHVYCLSGLGADHRIFRDLDMPDCRIIHLDWLIPQEKDESLDAYASRLAQNISHADPVLIGVSFGGMMAIEISKQISVRAVILISSVKSYHELPGWMKFFGKCRAEYLLPNAPLKSYRSLKLIRPIQNYYLGAKTEESITIANEFRENVDPAYLRWSVRQIFNWKNDWTPARIFHIHGDNDKLFPLKNLKPTHVINQGGHFMVMSHCGEINQVLAEIRKAI